MKKIISIFMLCLFLLCPISQISAKADQNNTVSSNSSSVDNVDIDAVFLYIDVNDPELQKRRPELKNCIKKDCENDELKYALRSVLKNIPWIRKIFIFMPNEKVKFLKDAKDISDKIIFVNQEELVGVTSSSNTLEWSLWKLKDKGCSDHVIYFNDDYFVGQPLNKSDFFYKNEKNEIVPYIFFDKSKISKINKRIINKKLKRYESKIIDGDNSAQTCTQFFTQMYSGRNFLYDALNCNTLLNCKYEYFPHNAISCNLTDIKFLYDIVKEKYTYWKNCLEAKTRVKDAIVVQDFYNFYYLNADKRKINENIKYTYFDMADKNIVDKVSKNKYDLFCINTGGGVNYSDEDRLQARETMNKLFPDKTCYEKD